MSYMDEYNKLKKKRLEEEAKVSTKATNSGISSYMNEYNKLKGQGNTLSLTSSFRSSFSTSKKDKDEEKEKEDDNKLDFFQKGSSDVTKVILGTTGDAALNVAKGFAGLGEGLGDLAVYGIAGAADALGKDEFADKARKRAAVNLVDKTTKGAEDYLNQYSVLGRTSDAVMQGVGQIGGIIATGGAAAAAGAASAGVTAVTSALIGLSGMGSGMGEAYEGGATDKEALTYGLISGTADAVSELIFGGLGKAVKATGLSVGLSSADDILAKKLSQKVSSTLAKNVIGLGVKSGAEGLEEVLAGTAQAVGKKLTYMSESDIMEIIEDENLLEQFVVGAFTSGIAQAPSVSNATAQGRDYISGLTKNEETVINKVYEDTVAEKEKNGKLTTKEKNKIYDDVVKQMERGYIDTDTIESVLGGETYEGYKSLTEQETAIKDEIESLENTPESQFTVKQRERLTELREQLKGIDTKTAKSNLFTEVDKLTANDTKLRESYNEKARRGQAFEADLTKYDAKQQETIKKAVESGILNNTNRTHEFVDLVAKISADKGVLFDFTNNQKLKESGFSIDGKQVNGFVTKDGITVNVNSAKSLDTVVGHEITHVLEGTDLYTELQTAIVEYAKSKNDYQGRYDTLAKLYENVEGANIDSELTAELVGDYIFTDTDFIHNLSTNHRNVFQKVYDEIKYLYKVATAGSKEARELERVKKLFEEAYRGETKNTADSGVKHSLSNVNQTRITQTMTDEERTEILSKKRFEAPVYEGQADETIKVNQKDLESQRKGLIKSALVRIGEEFGVFTDYDISDVGVKIELSKGNLKESVSKEVSPVQLAKLLPVLKGTVENAIGVESHSNRYFYDNSTVLFENLVGGYFEGDSFVPIRFGLKHSKNGDATLYVIVDQNKIDTKNIKAEVVKTPGAQDMRSEVSRSAFTVNLAQIVPFVNSKDLLRYIPDGMLTDSQKQAKWEGIAETIKKTNDKNDKRYREFLASGNIKAAQNMVKSAANASGYPIVGYHGTKDSFTVFKGEQENQYDSGYLGSGFYFTDKKESAEEYSKWKRGYGDERVLDVALKMNNPLVIEDTNKPHLIAVQEALGLKLTDLSNYLAKPNKQVSDAISEEAKRQGYDGIVRYSEFYDETTYVVFDSNQIKSTDPVTYDDSGDVIPLSERFNEENPDIRYSLSENTDARELSVEQQEYFKDSKVRDENGNLKVVYHGTPNSDYTIFKDGTYFTDNKAYADRYQNPSASSISSGKTASNPKTFEVYLNIKKPFDLSDAEARRIYIEDYIKGGNALGINPYLSDAEYAKIETIDWTEGEDLRDFLIDNEYDYDGLVLDEGADGGYGEDVQYRGKSYVIFNPEQAKTVDNTNPTNNPDMNLSLSEKDAAPTGKFLGKDMALETAPVAETKAEVVEDVAPIAEAKVEDYAPGESLEEQLAKADDALESLDSETEALFRDLSEQNVTEAEFEAKWRDLDKRYTEARQEQERLSAEMTDINNRKYESLDDSEIPPEAEAPYYGDAESIAPVDPFAERDMIEVGKRNVKAYMYENPEVKPYFQDAARGMLFDLQNGTKGERLYNDQVYYESGGEQGWMGTSRKTTKDIADLLDQWGYTYAQVEAGLNAIIEDNGKENNAVSKRIEFMLDNRLRNGYKDVDGRPIPADDGYINLLKEKQIDDYRSESFDSFMEVADQYAPPAEDIAPLKVEPATGGEQKVIEGFEQPKQEQPKQAQTEQAPERLTRAKLHSQIVDRIKSDFNRKGLDFDDVLKNAKRMNGFSINDNTPQRVNDKTFGYEAGEALNEITFNRAALRESNGVKWLNKQVDTIRNLSKKYKIKPLSKESAAAQMYAEGFWVNDKDEIIAYGDAELAKDFPDVKVQNRIKALANDPTIRKIYDDTLSAINKSRTRNAYPEIPRLENYYLHFRAMDDTFSRLGVPFNPNDIKAKDLPTDINGTTIDRKPGQPFFASSMHREGKRTSFDMLGGIEKYLNSAKNQIYHIDDIQTTRALWGYIADKYGQAHGLENLDHMAFEAQQEHIKQVYDGHLSNYARFLVEYANNLAGKTALIDRGVEGLIGRRALQFINTVNTQAGRNQVGYSISSPLTNFIPSMEAIARTSKRDSIKAFAQTVSNVFRKDGFVESDPTLIRRKGADKFSKTLWEKMSDPGYILMGAVDNVTSEFIVRTKYNELTRKGMDSKQAHIKAGEWASRIMGDRSLGQTPLLYNSKFMGLFTKYQLEVRNALDSQFYDTYQEAKTSTKEIENQKAKNAVTAAKFAYRAVQIAALNHLFGMAFEKIAGYNPAFDIISTIATLFGWDDEEDDEDTIGDNAEQAFKELLGDLPYTSLLTDGGRIPIGSAMPIKQLISGVDKYGNEKSRLETLAEAAPYYLLPGGYGQIKKTTQGLGMFSDEHPVSGSYTDSGNLRFPVEKTFGNVLQAGLFGQYASENARDYFDNERSPLKEKQIQEYIDVDIPIQDYWDYREGLAKLKTNEDKVEYIDSLDLPLSKKNILVNNVLDRKEDVDLKDYDEYGSLAEFDFAVKYPEKYQFFEENGISYEAYSNSDDDTKDAYNWAFQNPDKYTVSKAISEDVVEYKSYTKGLSEIQADKDENGKSINGSRKEKVFAYIESLPLDYGQKCILFKSQYKADDSMNMDIIEYLDSREDIDYEEMVTILKELDFTVEGNQVYWD